MSKKSSKRRRRFAWLGTHKIRALFVIAFAIVGVALLIITHAASDTTPVYRVYNASNGDHLYTISSTERDNFIAFQGYVSQGTAFDTCVSSSTGAVPVYRSYFTNTADHYYTTDAAAQQTALRNGYSNEGIGFYACASSRADAIPVYGLFNTRHYYTTSAAERDNLVSSGWANEGTVWYASNVNAPPPPPRPPSPPPSPVPVPAPSPPSFSPNPSTPPANNTKPPQIQGSAPPALPLDTTPPTTPTNFTANSASDSTSVSLSWTDSTDDRGVKGYLLERSTNQQNWQALADGKPLAGNSFTDDTAVPQTHYYYRVKAIDDAGNVSSYAQTDVMTQALKANTFSDQGITINSQDGLVSMTLPAGTLSEPALCKLQIASGILPPSVNNYDPLLGPYELICLKADGTILNNFGGKTVSVRVITRSLRKKYSVFQVQQHDSEWHQTSATASKDELSFTLTPANTSFVLLGKHKKTSPVVKITIILSLILGIPLAILAGIYGLYRWRNSRAAKNKYDDYRSKELGL